MSSLSNFLSATRTWINKHSKKVGVSFFLILTVIAGIRFFSGLDTVVYQCDEYSYLSKSSFLDLYLAGKFSDPQWQSGDATDQTKLMEYMFGLPANLLYGKSFIRLAQEESNRFGESYINYADWAVSYGQPATNLKISPRLRQVLLGGRMIAAFFTIVYVLLGAFSLYWVFKRSLVLAGLGFAFLVTHPIVAIHGRQVLADSALNSFLVLGFIVQLAWWQTLWRVKKPTRKLYYLTIVLGLVGGLAAAAKLNGFLHLILTEALIGLGLLFKLSQTNKVKLWLVSLSLAALTVAGVTGLVFFSLHPNTWPDPVGEIKQYFDWRWWITGYYQDYFAEDSIDSWPQRLQFILLRTAGYMPGVGSIGFHWEARYGKGNPLWYLLPHAVLLVLGLFALGKKLFVKKSYQTLVLPACVWSVGFILLVSWYLKLDWTRYYWPLFVPVTIIDGFGLVFLGNQVKKIWRRNR